ncbi:hypothetical protein ACQEVM_20905 [Streptomyces sp. CA-243310]|uniref:hypothetical protein n=1 Tax=Streptomyces sp. CA-243310 TaxID=3240056 RepID=UPI003D9202C8
MNRVAHGLAANPALPGALLDRLIALADEELASALAERGDLRHDQAVALAAAHPALSPSLLASLLTGPDEGMAEAAARNPSLPPEVMEGLVP